MEDLLQPGVQVELSIVNNASSECYNWWLLGEKLVQSPETQFLYPVVQRLVDGPYIRFSS
jgi:hypothetical protein